MTTLTDLRLADAISDIRQCEGYLRDPSIGNREARSGVAWILTAIHLRLESLRADLEQARTPECVTRTKG